MMGPVPQPEEDRDRPGRNQEQDIEDAGIKLIG